MRGSVWARISKRQQLMREVLAIEISDDVLPLGNLNGVYFPFMLDTGHIFAAGKYILQMQRLVKQP